MTTSEISHYVLTNLTKIKHAAVSLEEKPLANLIEVEKNWLESTETVSSLRLDNVLKEIYNISRKNAVEFVKKGHVKLNYKVVDEPGFQVQENDMISLRGKGRSKLSHIGGKTRKDRIRISIAVLK